MLRVEPGVPDTGKEHGLLVGPMDVPGLFGLLGGDGLPFVEPVDREDGSSGADEPAVGGFFPDGFGSGVDHLRADRAFLRPLGDEPEVRPVRADGVGVVVRVDDGAVLGGRDVIGVWVAGRERLDEVFVRIWDAEEEFKETIEGVWVNILRESATHVCQRIYGEVESFRDPTDAILDDLNEPGASHCMIVHVAGGFAYGDGSIWVVVQLARSLDKAFYISRGRKFYFVLAKHGERHDQLPVRRHIHLIA